MNLICLNYNYTILVPQRLLSHCYRPTVWGLTYSSTQRKMLLRGFNQLGPCLECPVLFLKQKYNLLQNPHEESSNRSAGLCCLYLRQPFIHLGCQSKEYRRLRVWERLTPLLNNLLHDNDTFYSQNCKWRAEGMAQMVENLLNKHKPQYSQKKKPQKKKKKCSWFCKKEKMEHAQHPCTCQIPHTFPQGSYSE